MAEIVVNFEERRIDVVDGEDAEGNPRVVRSITDIDPGVPARVRFEPLVPGTPDPPQPPARG